LVGQVKSWLLPALGCSGVQPAGNSNCSAAMAAVSIAVVSTGNAMICVVGAAPGAAAGY
jgi:hypothetical protein